MKPIKTPDTSSDAFRNGKDVLKKIGLLLLNFALIYGLFRLILTLSLHYESALIYYIGVVLYAATFVALFIAYFVLNGYTFRQAPREANELPEKWSQEEKDNFLARQSDNKAKAKRLLYFILPLALTVAISYIELYLIG